MRPPVQHRGSGTAPAARATRPGSRERRQRARAGEPGEWPVYAVYDWFVKHPAVDWPSLFDRGLGQVAHAPLLRVEYPHAEITETRGRDARGERRDVVWRTETGELHERYRGEWCEEHLVKSPADYRILSRALEDTRFTADDAQFERAEMTVGENGVTMGQLADATFECRTALMAIQIDCAGLERFAVDLANEEPALLDLVEQMDERMVEKVQLARSSRATLVKLWENLSIETIGPAVYRRFLAPVYRRLFDALRGTDKGLHVHYDGKLRPIAEDIRSLPFAGLDSLTGPPEGDCSAAEARAQWPDKFLWIHPNLEWYGRPEPRLRDAVRRAARDAGDRFCLMISEEVPADWERTIPLVLDALGSMPAAENRARA